MKRKILEITKKPFVRNVIILTSGTAAAQLVGLAMTPLITRMYGPEAYGLMGTFIALVSILIPIAALSYPIAIVLPKDDREAIGIARLSLLITFITTLISGLFLLYLYQPIVRLFQLEEISTYLWLIPIVILTAGILQIIEQWIIRSKQFKVSAQATFLQAFFIYGGQAGVGFLYPLAPVLIIFTALKQGTKAILLLIVQKITHKRTFAQLAEGAPIKGLFKKYKDFALFRTPEISINVISGNFPILMLTSLFGPASAGFYTISRTVLSIPTQLIGKSVGDVFYPRIAEAANKGEDVTVLIKKATIALGAVAIVPYSIVILFGPWLFGFVFGEEWIVAGEYARWIAIWSYFGFMNQPSVRALPVLSAQAFHLRYTIFMLVVRIVVIWIGFYIFSSDKIAIALFGISGALLNIGLILVTIYLSKKFVLHNRND